MEPDSTSTPPQWSLGRTLTVVGQRVTEVDKKATLKKVLCGVGEVILVTLQFNLVYEALEGAGMEMKLRFIDLPLVGWMFTFSPELTGMHLLALLAATCFVGTPVALWVNFLDGFSFRTALPAERAGACLFLIIFLVTIAVDVWVVRERITIGASNPWGVQTGQEPELVAAMGVILALVNIAFAYVTALVYHSAKKRSPGNA